MEKEVTGDMRWNEGIWRARNKDAGEDEHMKDEKV